MQLVLLLLYFKNIPQAETKRNLFGSFFELLYSLRNVFTGPVSRMVVQYFWAFSFMMASAGLGFLITNIYYLFNRLGKVILFGTVSGRDIWAAKKAPTGGNCHPRGRNSGSGAQGAGPRGAGEILRMAVPDKRLVKVQNRHL